MRILRCFAHRMHLVICNELGLWKKFRQTSDQTEASDELSQTVKKMSINLDQTEEQSEEENDSEGSELECLIW